MIPAAARGSLGGVSFVVRVKKGGGCTLETAHSGRVVLSYDLAWLLLCED
jgi:hypothetical protein